MGRRCSSPPVKTSSAWCVGGGGADARSPAEPLASCSRHSRPCQPCCHDHMAATCLGQTTTWAHSASFHFQQPGSFVRQRKAEQHRDVLTCQGGSRTSRWLSPSTQRVPQRTNCLCPWQSGLLRGE